jgi:hypothetical protein
MVPINQVTLPSVPCCVVPVEVTSWGGSSVSTLMTLLTESGEDTPLESLSMSSVSGLNNSRDSNRGRGRARGSGRPRTMAVDRRTSGNGFLTAAAPAIRPARVSLRHMKPGICTLLQTLCNMSQKFLAVGSASYSVIKMYVLMLYCIYFFPFEQMQRKLWGWRIMSSCNVNVIIQLSSFQLLYGQLWSEHEWKKEKNTKYKTRQFITWVMMIIK